MRPALLVIADDDPALPAFDRVVAGGLLEAKRQVDLADLDLEAAGGLIMPMNIDQVDLAARSAAVGQFLASGRRIVFNGHVVRPFIDGLRPFRPLPSLRRADLELVRLEPHPIFDGVPTAAHVAQKGVAGFYGRGHNPPPDGARPLTGIGPDRQPVDWEWLPPSGGGLLVHSGNDLWESSDDPAINRLMAERLVAWALATPAARYTR